MDVTYCDGCSTICDDPKKGRVEIKAAPPESMRPGVVTHWGPWVRNFSLCPGCVEKLKTLVTFDPSSVRLAEKTRAAA